MTDARIGTELAGYRLERLIGRGGMGEVYLATQSFPERRVAVKVLARELAEDGDFRERFIRESNAAASTEHPNIVPIYGAGEHDGVLYLAMRYVEGVDLGTLIARDGPLDPTRAVRIVTQVAAALDAAHRRGLVHRDVKPGNILIAEGPGADDQTYLSDFGLIRRSALDTGLTKTGQFMGSIDYCAPEQIRGDPIDERADIYSLGCVLFESLTGERPFARPTEVATLYGHLEAPPPSAVERRSELPKGVDAVIAKAMAKRPDDRYMTAGELATAARRDLGISSDEHPVQGSAAPQRPRRRGALLAGATLLVLGLAAVVWAVSRNSPELKPTGPSLSAVRIDPDTDRVVGSARDVFNGVAAVAGEGALWVVSSEGVTKRNETTGAVETVIQVDDPLAIHDAFGAIWVGTHAGAKATVVKIDPAIDEVVGTVDVSQPLAIGRLSLADGEGAVWALDGEGNLTKIEPLSGKAVARFAVGAGTGLAVGAGTVWVADNLHDAVSKLDPETGDVLDTIELASAPDVIAFLDGKLWAVDSGAATVTTIDPSTLQPGRSIGVARGPVAIAGGLGSVWIAGVGALTRIDQLSGDAREISVNIESFTVTVDSRTGAVWLIRRPPGQAYGA
jgi:hypothetical protein